MALARYRGLSRSSADYESLARWDSRLGPRPRLTTHEARNFEELIELQSAMALIAA